MKIASNNSILKKDFDKSFRKCNVTEKFKSGRRSLSQQIGLEMTFIIRKSFWEFVTLTIILFYNQISFCNDKNETVEKSQVKNRYELLSDFKIQEEPGFFDVDFTPRRTKALIFSTFVPGSGQTYLGNELKGMGISLAFYGTALAAIIAHNNAQGREDRIKVLTQDYKTKGNYNDAERVWQSILGEVENRDNDYDRRTIFSWLAAGVWVYNIFDLIFLTDDAGETEFAAIDSPLGLNIVSANNFYGVALKLNVP